MMDRAEAFYANDPILYVDMHESVKRGLGTLLYAAADGVLLFEAEDGCRRGGFATVEAAERVLTAYMPKSRDDFHAFIAHDEAARITAARLYPEMDGMNPCLQCAYLGKEAPKVDTAVDIRILEEKDLSLAHAHYQLIDSIEFLAERRNAGALFGAYEGETLLGFAGWHEDGAVGMLEVLPQYRRRHIGAALDAYCIQRQLDRGWTPYGQIILGNEASVQMQERLGYTLSRGKLYWMF